MNIQYFHIKLNTKIQKFPQFNNPKTNDQLIDTFFIQIYNYFKKLIKIYNKQDRQIVFFYIQQNKEINIDIDKDNSEQIKYLETLQQIRQMTSLQRTQSQSPTKSNKPFHKNYNQLYIRITINDQEPETMLYSIVNNSEFQYDQNNTNKNVLCVKIDTILKIASSIISKKKIKINKFMNIFIEIQKKRVNIFKLKKALVLNKFNSSNSIKIKRQDQTFYLDVFIVEINKIQANPLLELTQQKMKYNVILEKLTQVNQMFAKDLQVLKEGEKRSYDVAYFFAQPLVQPQELDKYLSGAVSSYQNVPKRQQSYWASGSDVSFQKQYDKFVKVLKQQNFFRNITVEMMVANQFNIRQVLNQRCNILHFACHGETKYLKIQDHKNIGFLNAMTAEQLIKLLEGKIRPKIILFNACYSNLIAEQIHKKYPQITTIGYDGKANDKYCQLLTQRLYSGIYQKKQSIGKIIGDLKKEIQKQDKSQADKLKLFCKSKDLKIEEQKTSCPELYGWNYDWAYLQNLGPLQPLGIKKKLYDFIKSYLNCHQKQLIIISGSSGSGKTIFIKKALYYTMHRHLFQQKLYIDCYEKQQRIVNMLQFKLIYKKKILKKIQDCKGLNLIIVIDHCNYLIRNQPEDFINFMRKIAKHIKLGKLVIITDNYTPLSEINRISYEQQVYENKEIVFKTVKQDFRIYLIRWAPFIQKNNQLFQKYRISTLMKSLKNCTSNKEFLANLNRISQEQKIKQTKSVMVNLQEEINSFKSKIQIIEKKVEKFISYGYYSRNFQQYVMLNIFNDFIFRQNKEKQKQDSTNKNTQKNPKLQKLLPTQRRDKSFMIQELTTFYQNQIKNLINNLISALGKFRKDKLDHKFQQQAFMYITQKSFIIISLTILIHEPKQIEIQLFNLYTLIVKLMNRYQTLMNSYPNLLAGCQTVRLKIYMTLYNLYKCQYYLQYEEQIANKNKKSSNQSYIRNNQMSQINLNDQIDFLPHQADYPYRDSIRDSYNGNRESYSDIKDGINFSMIRRQSMRSQQANSGIAQQPIFEQRASKRFNDNTKSTIFEDFQKLLKQEYGNINDNWELIGKVQQMDTLIRMIKIQEASDSNQLPILSKLKSNSSFFESSIPQTHRKFYEAYCQVQNFYKLHQTISNLYSRFDSFASEQDRHFIDSFSVKRQLFFKQKQLEICYLYGLKFIQKLFESLSNEYLFDYQQWYKQKFKKLRDILVRSQKILTKKISPKIMMHHDYSYKKIYQQSMQIYIDLRYNLQKSYSIFEINGQKRLLSIFQKLLKFAQDVKSIQLKNKIQDYVEKFFYNKCSILISEPLGYFRKSLYNDKKKTDKRHGGSNKHADNSKQTKKQKQKITLKNKKQNPAPVPQYTSQQNQNFFPLNILRHSQLILRQMKQQAQSNLQSQIHIEIQALSYCKLKSLRQQTQDKKKKRLIYLIICDCWQSQHHKSIFLQNEYGESEKHRFKDLQKDHQISFPYAPVIILFGSNTDTLKYFYRDQMKKINKKMAFISLKTQNKLPEIQGEFVKKQAYFWRQYLQKQIGLNFLSNFWKKFCQIYFDQEHQSFQNQVIRSFNIAKIQGLILTKKKYCQGLSRSQVEKEIDNIINNSTFSLQFFEVTESDPPVSLGNNIKNSNSLSTMTKFESNFSLNNQRQQYLTRGFSTLEHSYINREQEILSIHHRQIGANLQVYSFLKQFFVNMKDFQQNKDYQKSWIKYNPQINQTNLYIFAKTIYYKLLRMGNKFELGVQFKDFTAKNQRSNEDYRRLYQDSFDLSFDSLKNNRNLPFSIDIPQQESEYPNMNLSSQVEPQKGKKKKVQIYYNVPYLNPQEYQNMFESFKQKDEFMLKHGYKAFNSGNQNIQVNNFTPNPQTIQSAYIFRILIVNRLKFDPQLQFILQKPYSCKISAYKQNISITQNSYHVCDTILNYSKKIEDFKFEPILKTIYPKKDSTQDLKTKNSKELKDKIIQKFEKNYENIFGHHNTGKH